MPFADRRSDGVLVSVLASLALLGGCAARPEGAPAVADGRYDSRFPQEDVAPLLERISRSVHMVTAIAYYKVHTVPLSDSIESSNLPPELLDRYAQGARYINSVNVGASTIVGLGTRQTLVLTCAHVVNYPDTIFTYHLTAGGVPSRFLSSIGLRARVSVSVGIFPQGGELELVALDSGEDLALLGAHFSEPLPPTISVFSFPLGRTADLEWGSFVYVVGYPVGHQMVTHGLVSLGRRPAEEGFFVDAGMGRGFSGGPVLAIRDGLPHIELVGLARMMPGKTSFVLVPEESQGGLSYDPEIPYRGEAYVRRQTELHYGMARAISAEAIRAFLQNTRSAVEAAGYQPPMLPSSGKDSTLAPEGVSND